MTGVVGLRRMDKIAEEKCGLEDAERLVVKQLQVWLEIHQLGVGPGYTNL